MKKMLTDKVERIRQVDNCFHLQLKTQRIVVQFVTYNVYEINSLNFHIESGPQKLKE